MENESRRDSESEARGLDGQVVCAGCGRADLHKMCPAYGTPYYMSGKYFSSEAEAACKAEREKFLAARARVIARLRQSEPSGSGM